MSAMPVLFERLPPHDAEAEEACVAAALVDPEALGRIVGTGLQPEHFFRDKNAACWAAILSLWERDVEVNQITVAHELVRRDRIEDVGGQTYLGECVRNLPTSMGAQYWAESVLKTHFLRECIQSATSAMALAYREPETWEEVVEEAMNRFLSIGHGSGMKAMIQSGAELAQSLVGPVEEFLEDPSRLTGYSTGFRKLDYLLGGLERQKFYLIAAETSIGKALAVDTPLPTPTGWTLMADVRVGDQLLGADGKPCRVTAVTPVMYGRPCYRVRFTDGSTLVADGDHQWLTETVASFRSEYKARTGKSRMKNQNIFGSVKTTNEIAATLLAKVGGQLRPNHCVQVPQGLQLPSVPLPLEPYSLGVWLGDGDSASNALTCFDPEIVNEMECRNVPVRPSMTRGGEIKPGRYVIAGWKPKLREAGLLNNKHIPPEYLRASEEQRRALLAGLLDTDGTCTQNGRISFAVTSEALALGAKELILSLGYKPWLGTRRVRGRTEASSTCYILEFKAAEPVFRLTRKRLRQRPPGVKQSRRWIEAVEAIPSVPVRCVQVDSADHMYLAGHDFIPTHNSLFVQHMAVNLLNSGVPVLVLGTEMHGDEWARRLIFQYAAVDPKIGRRQGYFVTGQKDAVRRAIDWLSAQPLEVVGAPNPTIAQVRMVVRRFLMKHHHGVVVLDHVDKIQASSGKTTTEAAAVAEIMNGLLNVITEADVPMVAVSHMSRPTTSNQHSKIHRLRGGGAKDTDSNVIAFLTPVDPFTPGRPEISPDAARHMNATQGWVAIDCEVHKNRGGETGTVPFKQMWRDQGGRFVEV